MAQRIYTLLTNDMDYIKELVHKGDLISMKLTFDILAFNFIYKITYK
jgi:hypothetical protein